ncbi:ribonuclease P protein component [Nocardioides gilvus]|uniref:ribonuclease P protein component n=1 Tax=Nocardioides gilvus TaxID=1735589 RepID=UPI000D7406C4|nr:ribonuclease P protein component [Nocardioides gilvus]
MLPRSARLTESERFRLAVRRGTRAGSRALVLHWLPSDDVDASQVGFVVSKAVGNAVVRNRVKRQLRHLTREHLTELPGRGVLVVRANPSAARVSRVDLERDLVLGLGRLRSRGE